MFKSVGPKLCRVLLALGMVAGCLFTVTPPPRTSAQGANCEFTCEEQYYDCRLACANEYMCMRSCDMQRDNCYSQCFGDPKDPGGGGGEPGDTGADLAQILKSGTASGRVELHVLQQENSYTQFALRTATAFGQAGADWDFKIDWRDYSARPDLFGIRKWGGASGRTEVHVLSSASNYQQFILQVATALGPTGDDWDFALGNHHLGRADLYAIHRYNTPSGRTELFVLSAASDYQQVVFQGALPLGPTGAEWDFDVFDKNYDGRDDLVAIRKHGAPSGRVELRILSSASNYQQFLFSGPTALWQTGDDWDYRLGYLDNDMNPDLFALHKSGTWSGTAELTILSGASGYQTTLFQGTTPLPQSWDNSSFEIDGFD